MARQSLVSDPPHRKTSFSDQNNQQFGNMLSFNKNTLYSILNGTPVLSLAAGAGLKDVKGEVSGDGAGADTPEVAAGQVNLFRSFFVASPHVDTHCSVEVVPGVGLDGRTHFFRYANASTGSGGTDNVVGVTHICYDHINDASVGRTYGNLAPGETDFDAADMSRAVRSVFPLANAADQNALVQALSTVQDDSKLFTGLWVRLLALADAIEAGLGFAGTVGNANAALVQILGPNIAGNPPRALAAVAPMLYDACAAGTGVTLLPVDVARHAYNGAVLRALTAAAQPNCGILIGPTRRSAAALFPEEHHILVYGGTGAMVADAFAAGAVAVTIGDVRAAMQWLMQLTGDEKGLSDAISWLACRVRFYGPNITNLPSDMTTRFHDLNPAIMEHIRMFHCAYKWDKTGDGEAELDALLTAVHGGVVVKRARDETLAVWGPANGDLRRIGETMLNCDSLQSYLLSLTTSEMTVLWHKLAAWVKRIDDPVAPGAGLVDTQNTVNLAGDAFAIPANVVAPTWNRVEIDESVSADGCEVQSKIPVCGGIGDLKLAISGKLNSAIATRSNRGMDTHMCTGPALRKRLYLIATGIRCAADVMMDTMDSYTDMDNYAAGFFETNNPNLDAALRYSAARDGGIVYLSDSVLRGLILNEAALYGLVPANGGEGINTYSHGLERRAFPDGCLRCCFHPSVARHFLGDGCGRAGGDFNLDDTLVAQLTAQLLEPWAFHAVEGVRSSEVAALCQFFGATKGSSMIFSQFVQHVEADLGGRESSMVNFMPNGICRPTENRVDLSLMTPSLWWYRPCYTGQVKLIGTGTQLRAGYNIVDGLRIESDPNVATTALTTLYSANVAVYVGPIRGNTRQRWLMSSNALNAPAPLAGMPLGIPRDVALNWFSALVGSISRAAGVARFISCIPLQVSRAVQTQVDVTELTIERVRARARRDAHGAVILSAGLKRLLNHADAPASVSVKGTDF